MEHLQSKITDTGNLEKKFNDVADRYASTDKLIRDHIELKRDHTFRVCNEIVSISKKIGLSDEDCELAYLIALFHDIGRFEQFFRFQTFIDSISINHAQLAVDIVKREFLDEIPASWHETLFFAILNHNIPIIEPTGDEKKLFFSRLIRDADKLDIWRVIADDELRKVIERSAEPEGYQLSDDIFECFKQRKVVLLSLASSINDMRLVRISWIFDINFKPAFEEIKKRKVLDQIFALIPESDRLHEAKQIVNSFLQEKIK